MCSGESSATAGYGKASSAPMPRREHRLMPRHRSQQRRANSCWFLMVSFSKPSRARRRRRTIASYSWSSTPSFCNRFGNFLAAINPDASSVRAKVRLKALRILNPCKIIRTGARSEAIRTPLQQMDPHARLGPNQSAKIEAECLTTAQSTAKI